MSKKLIAIIEVLETRTGLKKDEFASFLNVGDGLCKIKIEPDKNPINQVERLYHEWTHFIFSVFKVKKSGKKITDKQEEAICIEISDLMGKIFRKHFGKSK